jgi:hypothetical protein
MVTQRTYVTTVPEAYSSVPVDVTTIDSGDAVGINAGNARTHITGDAFHGFAEHNVDNSGGAKGDEILRVRSQGGLLVATADWSAAPGAALIPGATVNYVAGTGFNIGGTGDSIGKVHSIEADRGISIVFFQGTTVRSL